MVWIPDHIWYAQKKGVQKGGKKGGKHKLLTKGFGKKGGGKKGQIRKQGVNPSKPMKLLTRGFGKKGGGKKGQTRKQGVKTPSKPMKLLKRGFGKKGFGKKGGGKKGQRRKGGVKDPSKVVWVGGLAEGTTKEELKAHGQDCGNARWAEVWGKDQSTGVIGYATSEEVEAAIAELSGSTLNGATIEADHYEKKNA